MLLPVIALKVGKNERPVLGLLQIIVVMVYLWGGIHKFQSGWLSVWENNRTAPLLSDTRDGAMDSALLGLGYLIPPIEFLMALACCFVEPVLLQSLLSLRVTWLY